MNLTKEDSKVLKGVAILFMLFLHLFNQEQRVELCTTYIHIGNHALVSLFAKFTQICVPMYLFLSGYGLYISSVGDKGSYRDSIKRFFSLYLNFWIILILFVSLGCFIRPEMYPGSNVKFVDNITSWHTVYNGEWWFLFPYMVLVLLYPLLFKWVNQNHTLTVFVVGGIVFVLSYLIIYYNRNFLYTHQLFYLPILCVNILFPFVLGFLCMKENLVDIIRSKVSGWSYRNEIFICLILVLIIFQMILSVSIFNVFIAVLFILLFSILDLPVLLKKFLLKMGDYSTNIWLIHSFSAIICLMLLFMDSGIHC